MQQCSQQHWLGCDQQWGAVSTSEWRRPLVKRGLDAWTQWLPPARTSQHCYTSLRGRQTLQMHPVYGLWPLY